MKRTRFSDEQIIGILQEHEAGAKCADLCRKHGMSHGTFYAWKSKFSGMHCTADYCIAMIESISARCQTAESAGGRKRQAEEVASRANAPLSAIVPITCRSGDAAAMKELLEKKW